MEAALATARQILLRKPSLINVRGAALRLLSRKEHCSPAKAEELLKNLRHANTFLKLFQTAMPEEFKLDSGSRVGIDVRFYKVLGFPVQPIEYSSDPVGDGILIESLAGHICDQCGHFPDLPIHYQLAIYLLRDDMNLMAFEDESEEFREHRNWCWEVLAKAHRLPNRLRPNDDIGVNPWSVFSKQKSPFRFLPVLADAIAYSTGCVFFDFDPENGLDDELEWSPTNVAALRNEYKRAQEIQHDLDIMAEWIYENPRARVMKALRIYKQAEQEANAKKTRRRVPDAERRALVRIL